MLKLALFAALTATVIALMPSAIGQIQGEINRNEKALKAPDAMQRLTWRVEALEKQGTELKKETTDLRRDLAAAQVELKSVHELANGHVAGYAGTWITKTNWDRLPGDTGLKVWMRQR